MEKVGVYFGTFAPFHMGHLQEVYRAALNNDKVLIIVDGYDHDRGCQIGLNLTTRLRAIKSFFKDEEDISVVALNETDFSIPVYPNGWDLWTKTITKLVRDLYPKAALTWYVGEKNYKEELDKRLPAYDNKVVLSNRAQVDLSATAIRNDPKAHFNQILPPLRPYFVKKVLLAGGPSTGKSTLVRRLAHTANSCFSVESARDYEIEKGIDDQDLNVDDYVAFTLSQWKNNQEVVAKSNNGLVFWDTDAIVTRVYAKLYLSKADNEKLDPYFKAIIPLEKPDLIFVTKSTGRYVQDGLRNPDWSDDTQLFTDELLRQLKELGLMDKVVILDPATEPDKSKFYTRYLDALNSIDARLNYHIPHLF